MYHMGEQALKNGSQTIDVGAPALTEVGFYLQVGASYTATEGTKDMQEQLQANEGARDQARDTLAYATALKEWDSGAFFPGKVDQTFSQLPGAQQQDIVEATKNTVTDEQINQYLAYRGSYHTSPDGLVVRDIGQFMKNCAKSTVSRWKKIK